MEAHSHPHQKANDCCGSACSVSPEAVLSRAAHGAPQFRIPSMDCSAEEAEIRRALEPIAGVRSLMFRLRERTLAIDAPHEVIPQALEAIRKAGFEAQEIRAGKQVDEHAPLAHQDDHELGAEIGTLTLALVLAAVAEAVAYFAPDDMTWKLASAAVAAAAIWLAGLEVYKKGVKALLNRKLNINALMSVAVTGAFIIGQWPEAAMVMALYSIAELIEARSVDRARNAIEGLLALAPDKATMFTPDGTWKEIVASEVAIDAIVRIRPGERVPLDGVVTKGNGSINQAPVTGESIPVDKAPGDTVFAGTINETGELEFRVTAAANNTTLARIIHAVEQAQGTRAPTQRFVDRFAAVYTPAVFVLAVGVAVLAPFVLQLTWLEALYKALVLLVIACPCALVISTPVTVVSSLAAAARRGILIKGGTYLESARELRVIAIDKTGTVTEGKPILVESRVWAEGADKNEIYRMAASLAGRSDHPVSQAIAAGLDVRPAEVSNFKARPGHGVEGEVNGQHLLLGNHRIVHDRGLCGPELEAELRRHEEQGRTVTLLATQQQALAIFAVADTIRETSRQAIEDLQRLGVRAVMLTGDNNATAQAIARQAGIAEAKAELLPESKREAVLEMQRRYGPTGMAGDGINDAPALAQADIGFAMGGAGTDTAMEAADVVIMNDNLLRVAETVKLSRATHAVLWQNITVALGIKAVFFVLAVFGSATMWMAVFADMGASLLVVTNGLRLLRGISDGPKTEKLGSSSKVHVHAH